MCSISYQYIVYYYHCTNLHIFLYLSQHHQILTPPPYPNSPVSPFVSHKPPRRLFLPTTCTALELLFGDYISWRMSTWKPHHTFSRKHCIPTCSWLILILSDQRHKQQLYMRFSAELSSLCCLCYNNG